MPLLADGMSWLGGKLKTAGGVAVVYRRANVSAGLTAVVGDQQASAARLGQVQQASSGWMERDYLILAADLAAAGFSGPPQVGDRITETINGEASTFEAMRKTGSAQCWRWSEADRLTYRVTMQRV